MAEHARLIAPPPDPPQSWPWHKPVFGIVSALAIGKKDRRLEAETYLSDGYGIRLAIESQRGWKPFGHFANVWMPNRLKGILVPQESGTPILAATQVFDIRPIARKWVAVSQIRDAKDRFVSQGTVLVTRSGSVGRACMSYAVHEKTIISDDLLRIAPRDENTIGWVYAYLHSQQSRAMTVGSHYGHIIKHLEPAHLEAIPVPPVDSKTATHFMEMFQRIVSLRNASYRLTCAAEDEFSAALSAINVKDWGESGFVVKASRAFSGRRLRFDASAHNPGVAAIEKHLRKHGEGFTTLGDAGYDIWLPKRFQRIPASDGAWLLDSADLTEVNPDISKRIADGDFGDNYRGRVNAGWVLMARSGQTYGIIGTPFLATAELEGNVISDHVMRLKPPDKTDLPPGYVVTALGHPTLGRPLVKSLAYGSSIPEIEVSDMVGHRIVRLGNVIEEKIANLAVQAAESKASADMIERDMATEASAIISDFCSGVRTKSGGRDTQRLSRNVLDSIAPDA